MSRRRVVLGAIVVLGLAGAGGGSCRADRVLEVRRLGAGLQCGGAGEGISLRELGGARQLEEALGDGRLGGGAAAPRVDWKQERVLLVSAGQRPTAGWSIDLASPKAPVKDDVAGIRVALVGPADGAMNAQVVTSPCLVVALPRERLKGVGVLDGDQVVARLALE